jgi:soluble lytic murein transglycosylase-like protein
MTKTLLTLLTAMILSATLLVDEAMEQTNLVYTTVNAPQPPGAEYYDIPLEEDLQDYIFETCVYYEIPEYYELVLAVIGHESVYDIDVISGTNDYGLMQINGYNHAWLSEVLGIVDFLDPEQNVQAGIYMLSSYLHKYGDINQALMSYNLGEGGARSAWDKDNYSNHYTDAVRAKLDYVVSNKN